MQPDVVGLIGHVPEDGPLSLARIRQQGQGLIAVTGEDHLVKMGLLPLAGDHDAIRHPAHRLHRGSEADARLPARRERPYVLSRATRDHIPLGPVRHLQQPVVGENRRKKLKGKARMSARVEDQMAAPMGRM